MSNTIHDDLTVIIDLADLLVILLAQPDSDSAIDGMHKVAQVISDRAGSVRDQLDALLAPRNMAVQS